MAKRYAIESTILNLVLIVAVAIPSLYVASHCLNLATQCDEISRLDDFLWTVRTNPLHALCQLCDNHPLWFVNVAFLLNICVLFWIISRIQQSTWLIDPYWTIIPPLVAYYYHVHPRSVGDVSRKYVVLALTLIWSVRLTHSYFRREHWEVGRREDWRFTDMKEKNPKSWWLLSFFAAYMSQQPMLIGLTLPLWAVNFSRSSAVHSPFGWTDAVATLLCLCGIVIAGVADTQLYHYCEWVSLFRAQQHHKNISFRSVPPPPLVLSTGLWKYTRHPNYFGEQLWWWSLGIFGIVVGEPLVFVGAMFNTFVMYQVTNMTETRMMKNKARIHEYLPYLRGTSMWIPWFSTYIPGRCATTNK